MSKTQHQDSSDSTSQSPENFGNLKSMQIPINSKEGQSTSSPSRSLLKKKEGSLLLTDKFKTRFEQPNKDSQSSEHGKSGLPQFKSNSFDFNEIDGKSFEMPKLQSMPSVGSMMSQFKKIVSTKTYHFTVGRIQNGLALLINDDVNVAEFPLSLLPPDVRKGNVLKFSVERNCSEEEFRKELICNIQREIIAQKGFFEEYVEQKPARIEEKNKSQPPKFKEPSISKTKSSYQSDVLLDIKNKDFAQNSLAVVLDVKSDAK